MTQQLRLKSRITKLPWSTGNSSSLQELGEHAHSCDLALVHTPVPPVKKLLSLTITHHPLERERERYSGGERERERARKERDISFSITHDKEQMRDRVLNKE